MPKNIGSTLKYYRNNAKMSVKQISDILLNEGYKATESTIYSWENGNSQPTPGAMLTMCTAYGIKDVLSAFGYDGYNEDGSLQLNNNEVSIIEMYRVLDTHGKEMVDLVLTKEYERKSNSGIVVEYDGQHSNHRLIAFYKRMASAGAGELIFDEPPEDRIEIPDLPSYKNVTYAISVNGNSMEPLYHDNDILLVDNAAEVEIGDIGIFMVDNKAYVKQRGVSELISVNEAYPNIPLDSSAICRGKVIDKLQEAQN